MHGHVFVSPGDITQLAAHAIAYSASTLFGTNGSMYAAFRENVPGFEASFADLRRFHSGRTAIGDAFWIPTRADVRPHGVAVVVATGGVQGGDEAGAVAVRAAIDLSVASLRGGARPEGRLLVALPAFLVGMGGGGDRQVGEARIQVAAAREALERHPGVDVAFITYTPSLYRVYLEARRLTPGSPSPGPAIPPALERALIDRECVLFAGAGLSRGAGLPDWDGLIGRMAGDLGLATHEKLDHLDLAQWYRERFSRQRLADLIGTTFGDPTLAPRPTTWRCRWRAATSSRRITTIFSSGPCPRSSVTRWP